MQLNVNSDAVVKFSNKLDRLHRSAFPVAVRGALNNAAFDVKKNTMPKSASRKFTKRRKNFFKATSKVKMAQGFDVDNMKAMIGFVGNQQAVEDLEQQERGGTIKGRSFIPMDTARTSSSNKKAVRANARLSRIRMVNAADAKGKNDKEKFVKSVLYAGRGGYVLAKYRNKHIVWRVNSLKRTSDGNFKLTPVYTYDKGRSIDVNATNFMRHASLVTANKLEQFFINQAKRQFEKALR